MLKRLLSFSKPCRSASDDSAFVPVTGDSRGKVGDDTDGFHRMTAPVPRQILGLIFAVTLLLGSTAPAYAQDSSQASAPSITGQVVQAKPAPRNLPSDFAIPRSQEFELALIAGIGVLTLLFQGFLLLRTGATPADVSRVTLITLIITLATGTLIMGYDSQQIVPIIGLFGSIIGYLLGKGDAAERRKEPDKPEEGK